MKIIKFWQIALISLLGCDGSYEPTFMKALPIELNFEKSILLVGEKVIDETPGVDNIHLLDSMLILSTPALNSLYQIHSLHSFQKIQDLVKKGQGPNELNQALKPLYVQTKNDELLLAFYSKKRLGIFHLNLSKSLRDGEAVFEDTINLDGFSEIYRAYLLDDRAVFVDNLDFINLNQIYSIYDFSKNQIQSSDTAIVSKLQTQSEIYMMATCTFLSRKRRKYVSGMLFQDQLNIFDLDNPKKSISVSPNKNPSSLLENSQTIMPLKKEFYVDIRDGGDKFFALYANQSRKDWATSDKPAEIHVFNWNGEPICKLTTKEKILHFDIDKENNQLYGLTEKQEVIRYDLNQIPELAGHL